VTSSVVGPWGMMADGIFCTEGSTCSATSIGWLADVGADVGTSMDFCRFAEPRHLLKLCALLGSQQRLAGGHRHLLIVELERLVCLSMYPFVAAKQV
jgi:hypothetical protein